MKQPRKRSLGALRQLLKDLEAQLVRKGDPRFLNAKTEYYYQAQEDGDIHEIDRREFFSKADEGTGWPKQGVYTVNIVDADTDEQLWSESGVYIDETPADAEDRSGDPTLKMLQKVWSDTLYQAQIENGRLRARAAVAEEAETKAYEERERLRNALALAEQEVHHAKVALARAELDRDEALEREASAQQEMLAMRERGEDMKPVAEAAIGAIWDRAREYLGLPGDPERDDMFNVMAELCSSLVQRPNLPWTIFLAQRKARGYDDGIPWPSVRALITLAYDIDPGDEPPENPRWDPDEAKAAQEAAIIDAEIVEEEAPGEVAH